MLLAYNWQQGCICKDNAKLYKLARITEQIDARAFKEVTDLFSIELPDGTITHPKLYKLQNNAEKISAKRRKAAEVRWGDAHASAKAMQNDAIQSQIQKNTPPTPSVAQHQGLSVAYPEVAGVWVKAGWEGPEAFEQYWREFVRKHGKANKSGVALTYAADLIGQGKLKRPDFEAGYDAWSKSEQWTKENGRYKPNLWDFLNDRLWLSPPAVLDEPPEPRSVSDDDGLIPMGEEEFRRMFDSIAAEYVKNNSEA